MLCTLLVEMRSKAVDWGRPLSGETRVKKERVESVRVGWTRNFLCLGVVLGPERFADVLAS